MSETSIISVYKNCESICRRINAKLITDSPDGFELLLIAGSKQTHVPFSSLTDLYHYLRGYEAAMTRLTRKPKGDFDVDI